MALSEKKIQVLKDIANGVVTATPGECDNARTILTKQGVDWKAKAAPPPKQQQTTTVNFQGDDEAFRKFADAFFGPNPKSRFNPKTGDRSRRFSFPGVTDSLDYTIATAIALQIAKDIELEWQYTQEGCVASYGTEQEIQRLVRIYKQNRESMRKALLTALTGMVKIALR